MVALVLLTILGGLMRIIGVNWPITDDTAAMLMMHFPASWESLLFEYRDTNQRTLYIFLAKLSMRLLGESEFAYRLPGILAGVLAIPLAYRVGLMVTRTSSSSLLGALLLMLSSPHLLHTWKSRGYSLTVFLAIALVFLIYKMLEKPNSKLWTALFTLTGFSMMLIVPSNIHFLAAIGVFYFVVLFLKHKNQKSLSAKIFFLSFFPLLILYGLAAGYLTVIYADLQRAVVGANNQYKLFHNIDDLGISLERFSDVLISMVSPWGIWLYLFLIVGLLRLLKTQRFLFFIILFIVPVVLISLSGLLGPPRTYIYWLPFVLILIALGATESYSFVKIKYSKPLAYTLAFIFLAVIVSKPVLTFSENLSSVTSSFGTTFEDAKAASIFVENNLSDQDLIVIPYSDRVLRYYLEEQVAQNMLNILQNGRLGKIIFLGSADIEPHEYPDVGMPVSNTHFLKNLSFNIVQEFGGLRLYDLGLSSVKISPQGQDRDYENHINFHHNETVKLEHVEKPRLAGQQSLSVKQKGGKIELYSKNMWAATNVKEGNFFLLNLASTCCGSGGALFFGNRNVPTGVLELNGFYGVFVSTPSKLIWKRMDPFSNFLVQPDEYENKQVDTIWQVRFGIIPVPIGDIMFAEGFRSQKPVTYFDGLQLFLLQDQVSTNQKKITRE
jgi:hypothetical protein